MSAFLKHLATLPAPPSEGTALTVDVPTKGITVRARMPKAGALFFTSVGTLLAHRAARDVEPDPGTADHLRDFYAAIVCETVDGIGPIGGPIEPCRLVSVRSDATPAALVESVASGGDAPALWIWQILDGTSAKMIGDAVYTFAGEGRALPPFVSPADPSPPSPGSGGPSEPTP
jgi:hypothetical protein